MATVYIDGKPVEMDPAQNLLHGCLSAGFNLEYFCWHPALGSVGACRQCAVKQFKNEADTHGKIVMACLTPATDGARISIKDREAVEFRAAVIEGLMVNHPHDCPVCDEGGECHLQDMTVMTGHDYRHYRFDKRTFRNQDLGPLVNQEMNRCIQCYRCVRYYRGYAGGTDLNAFATRNTVFFGRDQDGVLENEFSGNLVEICPTGVFTDKTLKRHYTRKWDQLFAPSICVHCGVGCNTTIGERYGTLRRVLNRYNHDVNGYFLCDRGRFGYEFVNHEKRIRQPLLDGRATTAEWASSHLHQTLAQGRTIGIGSPRASLEANFALRRLVGADRFFLGMPGEQADLVELMIRILRREPMRTPTLHEMELCDAVLILGEDVTNVAPRIALAVRQSIRQQPMQIAETLHIPLWMDNGVRDAMQDRKGPLFVANPYATRLDDVATATFHAAPDDIARLGFAVAGALAGNSSPDDFPLAKQIAEALKMAARPLVISGASCNSAAIIQAAAEVARTARAQLCFTTPECNTAGAVLLGGGRLRDAFQQVRDGQVDTVVVLENDLYRRAPSAEVDAFLKNVKHLIVLDHLPTGTSGSAELVLPAATFAESDGTFVSSEGRAQRFFQAFPADGAVQASWRWLAPETWHTLDDVLAALATEVPQLAAVRDAAPSGKFRIAGAKIPRAPLRSSGRTAVLANINVSEPKTPEDPDSSLSFSMEGTPDHPPGSLIPFFWEPGWNSIQATNTYQKEIGGPLQGGDPGIRLFEPAQPDGQPFVAAIPPAFQPRENEWLLVPMHHIFGSEELSSCATAIAQLSVKPYVAVHSDDFTEGTEVRVTIGGAVFQLPVHARPDLPRGVAGLPAGVPPLAGLSLPAWGRIERLS